MFSLGDSVAGVTGTTSSVWVDGPSVCGRPLPVTLDLVIVRRRKNSRDRGACCLFLFLGTLSPPRTEPG